ncbi:unnamed protein product [Rotaria magnacalcarata]|uniref:Uncharacterized protein n=1 Tax=Rotaria magnacalcarata TaxID=392030 RepID=A0A816ZV10_9BILA|nr:unnamed protein product [Rotaria magnacalcarata]CAF1608561.1 unnamed protein product [Rotaria magnacalcarata]CAF2227065.1 unnamed protein product [Rotaria magnacalcarata]CAF3855081.1 unnamed protein product [Rotaria magnacalcarata]CAF3858336.1 unnamed protein product [Rotaria magnacalcarata]
MMEQIVVNDGQFTETTPILQSEYTHETEPTAEELTILKRISDHIPLAARLIMVCEFCERFAYLGLSGVFQNYIQFPVPGPHDKQPGALGRGQRTATLLTTFFRFWCFVTPTLGAILADQYWGKYKTIFLGCVVYLIGLSLLVLSSTPFAIHANLAFHGLIVAMIILGLATGGLKSNVSPLMAEQYTRTKPIVKVIRGEKKIIDPKVTVQSMFNWFYWSIYLGALSSIITTNVEKYYSYWLAYLLPMMVFILCIVILVIGRHRYIRKPPNGSLLLHACQITIRATYMRYKLGKQDDRQHFLDYAKENSSNTIRDDEAIACESNNNQFIEDLKQAWDACRVFAFFPVYWMCCLQTANNMISQAAQMNVGPLPNDVLQNINYIIALIFIPIFDLLVYPALRRYNIGFTSISRMTCGFFLGSIAMAWTAFVQHLIYSTSPNYDYTTKPCQECQKFNNITVAWQIPSYFLISISEVFAAITGLEYAYTKAPASMKSVVVSLFLLTTAIGNALSFVFLPLAVDPKLLWVYVSLAIVTFIMATLFFLRFRNEQKKEAKI